MSGMVESIRGQLSQATLGDVGLWLLAVVPYLAGWLIGALVWLIMWIVASVKTGYLRGRGA